MILEIVLPVPLHKSFDYLVPSTIPQNDLLDLIGKRVTVPFGRTSLMGVVWNIKSTSSFPVDRLKPIYSILDEEPIVSGEFRSLAEWISVRYACSLGDALFALLPSNKVDNTPVSHSVFHEAMSLPLNRDDEGDKRKQQKEILHNSIYSHISSSFFVQGESIAQRIDFYMSSIKDALAQHKNILILVPEIKMAVDVHARVVSYFGDASCALWHGDQKKSEHDALWWEIKRRNVSVLVGTRSAILTPLTDLGLVIIEEENSASYKEERRPRYNAKDVAAKRGRDQNATVIFGGVAPSVETYWKIKEKKMDLIDLVEAEKPKETVEVRVVDMRTEGRKGLLSPVLEKELGEKLKKQQKAILFLNRRGFHKSFRCKKCLWVPTCPRCSLALTPVGKDKATSELLCHWCHHNESVPKVCPECGGKKLQSSGYGTEKLRSEVQEKFPWARVARMDSDSPSLPEEFDILVGTELVTHGFHLPHVGLVAMVDADVSLRIPDFRASERTLQLLSHLRTAMEKNIVGGEMIIQTRNPDHETFVFLGKKTSPGLWRSSLSFAKS